MAEDTKPAVASKLNWTGAGIAGLGAALLPVLSDPNVAVLAGQVLGLFPVTWVPYITMLGGIAVMVLRTFGTSKAISGALK